MSTTTTRVTLANRTLTKKNNIKTTISNCSPIVSKNSHKIWCIIKVQAIVRRWLAINRYKKMKLEFLKKKQLSGNSSSGNLTCTINIHSSPQLENDQSVNNNNSNNNNTDDIAQTTTTTEVETTTTTTIPPPIEISQSSPKLSVSNPSTTSASISNSASTSSSSISSMDDYIASLGIKDNSDNDDNEDESSSTDSDYNEKVKENVQVIAPVIQIEEIVKESVVEEPVEEEIIKPRPITTSNTNNNSTTPITSRSSSVSSTISMSSSLSSSSLSSSVSDSSTTSSNLMCNSSSSLSSSINSSTEKSSPMYQRKRTLDEMLKVERGYVNDMTTLIEVFLKPFRDVDTFFPKNYLYTLFCNIEELKDLHQQFLNDMEKKFEPTNGKPADLAIGDLFLPFMGSFQKLYESYINNYEKAFALTRYFKINPNYQEIQKSIYQKEKDPRCRHLDFNSFLVIPIQRLPRYIVLLKEIEKNTPQSDSDFNFIALSLVQLQDLTLYLNESKRKSSFSDKVDEIKSNVFGATAIIGNSKYIMEGQLSLLKGVVASTKKDLFVYLFKDCIICTETNVNYGIKDGNGGSNTGSPNNNLTPKKQVLKSLTTSASTPNNLSASSLSTTSFSTSSTSSSSSSPNSTLTHSTSSGASSGSPLSTLHNSSNSNSSSNNYSKIIFKTIHFSDIKAVSILKNFKDSFQVVSQKKVYTFVAPSTEIRQRWVDSLNDCVNNLTPPPSPTIQRSRFATLSPKGRNRNSVNLSTSAEK